MKELILLTLHLGALFGLGGKIYWSKETTWTCGVWLASEEWQNEPTEAFFVFPKQEEIQCPVSAFKERSVIASNCKRLGNTMVTRRILKGFIRFYYSLGEKWASVWNPEVGVRVRQGDKLCSLAAERLNVTSFPNQQFPRGIMVS